MLELCAQMHKEEKNSMNIFGCEFGIVCLAACTSKKAHARASLCVEIKLHNSVGC